MLEEIHRVTPSVANGIVSVYPNVQSLVNGFRLHGENALENLPVRIPIPTLLSTANRWVTRLSLLEVGSQ